MRLGFDELVELFGEVFFSSAAQTSLVSVMPRDNADNAVMVGMLLHWNLTYEASEKCIFPPLPPLLLFSAEPVDLFLERTLRARFIILSIVECEN